MSAAAVPTLERCSEDASYGIPCAEIFEAGHAEAGDYSIAEIDEIVANFQAVSTGPDPLHPVPATLGHGPQDPNDPWPGQDLLESLVQADGPGKPAAAWLAQVWRDGPTLCARMEHMTEPIAGLIRTKQYRKMSAEIYPVGYPHGLPVSGLVLRAVSLLGSEPPKVKGLAQIPNPVRNSEQLNIPRRLRIAGIRQTRAGTIMIFSEVTSMDRDAMLEQLAATGFDMSLITDAIDDPTLAEILRVASASQDDVDLEETSETPETPMPETKQMADNFNPPAEPNDMDSAMKYLEYAQKLAERFGCKPMAPPVSAMPDAQKQMAEAFAEELKALRGELATARKEVKEVETFAEKRLASERKVRAEADLEALKQAGKVLPAEVESGLLDQLLLLDAGTVRTFAEKDGKQVKATQYDRFLSTLKARPPLARFADRVKVGGSKVETDEETARVQTFAETNTAFAHALKVKGSTVTQYVERFKELRKKRPELTARQYGVPADAA